MKPQTLKRSRKQSILFNPTYPICLCLNFLCFSCSPGLGEARILEPTFQVVPGSSMLSPLCGGGGQDDSYLGLGGRAEHWAATAFGAELDLASGSLPLPEEPQKKAWWCAAHSGSVEQAQPFQMSLKRLAASVSNGLWLEGGSGHKSENAPTA